MNCGPIVFDEDGEVNPTPSTSNAPQIRSNNIDEHSIAHVFLSVHKFLEQQNCIEAAQTLRNELDRKSLLPSRSDPFDQSGSTVISNNFSRYQRTHSNITDLLSAVSKLHEYSETTHPLANSLKTVRLTENIPQRSITRVTNAPSNNEQLDPDYYTPDYDNMTTRDLLRAIKFGQNIPTNHTLLSRELKTNIKQYTKVMGHISPIYCVTFDRTGEYLITGADDNLIKVWDVRQCLLRYTYRGHFGEVSDLAVSHDNCLLASGSNDKTVRVWSLQDGSTKKAFMKHRGSITSVMFPAFFDGNVRYLISSALDCSICFYRFDARTFEFEKDAYHFKHKDGGPGKIITASTSAGGRFAAFSDTRKNIYVYHLTADSVEIISTIKTPHSRPDSLMWAHSNLKLLSGGSDGVLKCWDFQCNMWRCTEMKLPENELAKIPQQNHSLTLPTKNMYSILTMIWTSDDSYVVATGNDNVIRIWDTRKAQLAASLKGHEKTVFVIRNHPTDPRYVITAGHDGIIFLWDLVNFVPVKKLYNDSCVYPGRNDSILDFSFSSNGLFCSIVDDTGYITFMGIGNNEDAKKVPRQQFFHTDYLPCLNNEHNLTLDANSHIPPEMNNPPTFIQMEGIPHTDEWQRRIPGRSELLDAPPEDIREGAFCPWKKLDVVKKLSQNKLNDVIKHAQFISTEFEKIYEVERVKIPPKSWTEQPKPKKIRRSDQIQPIDPQQLPPNFDESDSDDATYSEGSGRSRSHSENDTENEVGGLEEIDDNDSDYYEGYHGPDTVFRNHRRRRRRDQQQEQNNEARSPGDNQQDNAERNRPRRRRRPPTSSVDVGIPNNVQRRNRHINNRPNTRANPAPELSEESGSPQRIPRPVNVNRRRRRRVRPRGLDSLPQRRSARAHRPVDYLAIEEGGYDVAEEDVIPNRRSARVIHEQLPENVRRSRRALTRRQSQSLDQDEETQDVEPEASNTASTRSSQLLDHGVDEEVDAEEVPFNEEELAEEEEVEQEIAVESVEVQEQIGNSEIIEPGVLEEIIGPESPESEHEQDSDYNEGSPEVRISDEENIDVDAEKPSTQSESSAVSTDYEASNRVRRSGRKRKPIRQVSLSSEDERPKRRKKNESSRSTIASSRPRRQAANNRNYADTDSEDELVRSLSTSRHTRSGREVRSRRY